jgi:glycosyltransferase involved in cell wall biosynthesis
MDVTVAICTWNRAPVLERALSSLCALDIPPGCRWEALVVDNDSDDGTEATVRGFSGRLPVRRVVEKKRGAGFARNRALDEAKGSLLLFTDDDCAVGGGWLREMTAAAERWPESSFLGGRVTPVFRGAAPDWIRKNLSLLSIPFAAIDLGEQERPFTRWELPCGANMALRPRLLGGRRFNPRLGPRGGAPGGMEETELFDRLLDAGHSGTWVPGARVTHEISAERLGRRYLWRRFHQEGRAIFRSGWYRGRSGPRHTRLEPWRSLYRVFRSLPPALALAPRKDARWLASFIAAATATGRVAGWAEQFWSRRESP